jgi:hypothetical protein
MSTLQIGGSDVTVGGEPIEFLVPPGTVYVSAQSSFLALLPDPTVEVVAQSAFVAMLFDHIPARRRSGSQVV